MSSAALTEKMTNWIKDNHLEILTIQSIEKSNKSFQHCGWNGYCLQMIKKIEDNWVVIRFVIEIPDQI